VYISLPSVLIAVGWATGMASQFIWPVKTCCKIYW